jgi:putative phage-type endonuclease
MESITKLPARRQIGAADQAAWLAERRTGIGASEAAIALGISKYGTPLKLFLQKTGRLPDDPENEKMRWGRRLEPEILAEFEDRTGRRVAERQVFLRHPERPHLLATLDAVDADGGVIEAKQIGERVAATDLGEPGSDQVPDSWVVQAHQQLYLAGVDHVTFAVLVGGNELREYVVRRRESVLDEMLPRLADFWRCVQADTPPPPLEPTDAALMGVLYPDPAGRVDVTDREVIEAVDAWELEGATQRESGKRRDKAKLLILQALGDHAEGLLPDGRVVRRKVVTVAAHECAESTQVRLSIHWPE